MTGTDKRATFGMLAAAVALASAAVPPPRPGPAITVYKNPSCACCKKWVQHLEAAGFRVTVHDTSDLAAIRARAGVPRKLSACHTAFVDDYVVEGHVPADVILRLVKERPGIAGVAVPGMPAGSPGMESAAPVRYYIETFDRSGA
ncbi:MAG TPA: DUF411 domain-containing protein, partial [Gemmatimonadales bacterium]|nr:DUF411 domain-containing protein [Gemmatimonadales bacterium]